jgi:hypothetical protein
MPITVRKTFRKIDVGVHEQLLRVRPAQIIDASRPWACVLARIEDAGSIAT